MLILEVFQIFKFGTEWISKLYNLEKELLLKNYYYEKTSISFSRS